MMRSEETKQVSNLILQTFLRKLLPTNIVTYLY